MKCTLFLFCLFVVCFYFDFSVPLENFSLIWRWKVRNFDLRSALKAIEQWGFFSMPHLVWHEASVYNGHLWEPVTLTPNAEQLSGELWLPDRPNDLGLSRLGFEPQSSALTHCATAAAIIFMTSYWSVDYSL